MHENNITVSFILVIARVAVFNCAGPLKKIYAGLL